MTRTDVERGQIQSRKRGRFVWAAVAICLALVATACSSSKKAAPPTQTTVKGGGSSTTLAPQTGGTITQAGFIQPAGLDPIVSTGHATTGAIEMLAIYDPILRYNHETGKYEDVTAQSLTANADNTVWTLKLKPGIKFTDGTDYNADAVVFQMNREREGIPGLSDLPPCQQVIACPSNPTSSTSYMRFVQDVKALDPLTVQFTLNTAWSGFPFVLSAEPSYIPSPTALRKCNPAQPPRQCAFNTHPVGAGPFMVQSFVPGEGLNLVRNPNYFGGQVYLDGLKFIYPGDAGGTKTLDFFNAGTVQTAFLRTPQAVTAAIQQKIQGIHFPAQGGAGMLFNVGEPVNCSGGKPAPICTGKPDGPTPSNPPTKDINVRKAIQAAIDPAAIDQRANQGTGMPGSELLQKSFTWYPNVPGPKYDPNVAKQYVAKAKADGWDGKVRVLANNTPTGQATGLAIDAMLKAVGIDDQLNISDDAGQMTLQYVVQHDFDIVVTGFATSNDEGGMVALLQNFSCHATSNRIGFCDPALDAGLAAVRAATNDSERVAGYRTVAQEVNAQVPFLPLATIDQFQVWSPKVHGIMDTSRDSIMFTKAWIQH